MIAKMLIKGVEATLNDDLTWASNSRRITAILNSAFSATAYPSTPSTGAVGSAQIRAVWSRLGGRVVETTISGKGSDDGQIY